MYRCPKVVHTGAVRGMLEMAGEILEGPFLQFCTASNQETIASSLIITCASQGTRRIRSALPLKGALTKCIGVDGAV